MQIKFLHELNEALNKYNIENSDDIIEYYTEIIEEEKEAGLSIEEIIEKLGTPKSIAQNLNRENLVKDSKEKKQLSSSLKALVAVVSGLSLPLIIIVALTVVLIIISAGLAAASILLGILAVVSAAIIGAIGIVIGLVVLTVYTISIFASGQLSLEYFLMIFGLLLAGLSLGGIIADLSIRLIKISVVFSKKVIKAISKNFRIYVDKITDKSMELLRKLNAKFFTVKGGK